MRNVNTAGPRYADEAGAARYLAERLHQMNAAMAAYVFVPVDAEPTEGDA